MGTTALQGREAEFLEPGDKSRIVNFKISAPSYATYTRLLTQPQGYPNTNAPPARTEQLSTGIRRTVLLHANRQVAVTDPFPHIPAQVPKKPHFAGKRRSRREVRAPDSLPERRCPATEHPRRATCVGGNAGPRRRSSARGAHGGAPQGADGGAAPGSASGPGRCRRRDTCPIPASARTKFYLFHFRSSPAAHPPEPRGDARPRCPPPPPAPGTAEPERCRGRARRAGAAGETRRLPRLSPGRAAGEARPGSGGSRAYLCPA